MQLDEPCQFLEWDSDFFGFRIGRVKQARLDQSALERIEEWHTRHEIACLYFLADADDGDTVRLAEASGFHFVDIRVTLEKGSVMQANDSKASREGGSVQDSVRLVAPSDIPALRSIARTGHRDSRFYYDPNFPVARCDAMYETWIDKSCNGYADAVFVADLYGEAVGYISCHLAGEGKGNIGLLGVSAQARGKGLGQRLIVAALDWFAEQNVTEVTVVTQGRNSAAQRLYQRCGFLTLSVQLWYHRWFTS